MLYILNDISRSVPQEDRNRVAAFEKNNLDRIREKYELKWLDFGKETYTVGAVKDSGGSCISCALEVLGRSGEFENSAKAVLLSDGIYNSGLNPVFKRLPTGTKLYAVGLGDTVSKPDIRVTGFNANSTAFLGNSISLEATFKADHLKGSAVHADVLEDGKRITSLNLAVESDPFFAVREFQAKPNHSGMVKYEILVHPVNGESNRDNNHLTTWVEVTDIRRKVDIVAHAPHPDVAAIGRALDEFGQYQVRALGFSGKPPEQSTDIYILHGLGTNRAEQNFVNQLIDRQIPFLYVYTAQCLPPWVRFEQEGFNPQLYNGAFTDAQAIVRANSGILETENIEPLLRLWPPLKVPAGKYLMPGGFTTVLGQKIGAVETNYPLLGFLKNGKARQGWLFGEGIWKWRLYNFKEEGNSEQFDAFIAQCIQYLTAGDIKHRFRVFPEKKTYYPGDNIRLFAEYRDEAGNLVNRENCTADMKTENGTQHYTFTRSGQRYGLDLGSQKPGDYSITARLAGPDPQVATGRFQVLNEDPEKLNLTADHLLLRKLSSMHSGRFYNADQLDNLGKELEKEENTAGTIKAETKLTELIHWKWFFAILIVLFGAEWFLRKREGGY